MKVVISTFFILIGCLIFGQTNFEKGFKEGFNNGYCYSKKTSPYNCYPPLPPFTPLPQINENSNSYQDGYNRGFIYGQARREKDDSNSSTTNTIPNPSKFNPYIEQNPILDLTPEERAYYYSAKARREQELANTIGTLLEGIFTVTPEDKARREKEEAERREKAAERKEKRRQERIIVYDTEKYYKLKKSKNIWLGTSIGFTVVGTASYLLSKNYYNQYKTATLDAETVYKKAELQNKIYPIAFALAGISGLEFIIKSHRINKANKEHFGLNLFPVYNGGSIAFTYNF